jgi:hypothetical protein
VKAPHVLDRDQRPWIAGLERALLGDPAPRGGQIARGDQMRERVFARAQAPIEQRVEMRPFERDAGNGERAG